MKSTSSCFSVSRMTVQPASTASRYFSASFAYPPPRLCRPPPGMKIPPSISMSVRLPMCAKSARHRREVWNLTSRSRGGPCATLQSSKNLYSKRDAAISLAPGVNVQRLRYVGSRNGTFHGNWTPVVESPPKSLVINRFLLFTNTLHLLETSAIAAITSGVTSMMMFPGR